ncbi:unnamed protein product [Owenia fusiformis]|uniref:EF-hand domain-containing protein n=1 Tax=Owenia fusiformis TaxID=6347 RepID=A0A8S4N3B1_OWEFU|nr:unnamed protein product [Owenia fusiformis]
MLSFTLHNLEKQAPVYKNRMFCSVSVYNTRFLTNTLVLTIIAISITALESEHTKLKYKKFNTILLKSTKFEELTETMFDNGNQIENNMPFFWWRKMKTHFVRHDLNEDGKLTLSDYRNIAKRVIEINNITGTDAQSIRWSMDELWNKYVSGGQLVDIVDFETWVQNIWDVVSTEEGRENIVAPVPLFFDAIDVDHDGKINLQDYHNYFKCIGIEQKYATAAYYCMDTQQQGFVEKKDFIEAIRSFFVCTTENDPHSCIWGPLVNSNL